MMGAWRELLGIAFAACNGLLAGASVAWASVVEAALTYRLTPAAENALIAWAIVSGAGMFVAAGLAAWQRRRR